MDTADAPAPTILYHYTSLSALMGIVKTGAIWATHLRYLNDSSENRYCRAMLGAHLDAYEEQHSNEHLAPIREALTEDGERTIDTYPYAASFSEEGNSLPQWRSYCQHGNGVCIGFRTESLRLASPVDKTRQPEASRLGMDGPHLEPVTYLDGNIDDKLDHLILLCSGYVNAWQEHQESLPEEDRDSIDLSLIADFYIEYQASLVKHAGFREEKEHRLIISNRMSTNLEYRCLKPR